MNWKKHKLPALLMLMIVVYSCASMGTPDGGPYDEEPPKFIHQIEENIGEGGSVSSSIGTT